MRWLQLALVLMGALMVGAAAAAAPQLPREAAVALCAVATVWAAMLGAAAVTLGSIGRECDRGAADP